MSNNVHIEPRLHMGHLVKRCEEISGDPQICGWPQLLEANGDLWAIPCFAAHVLRLSPLGVTAIGPELGGGCKWRHGAVAADGKIYAFPWQAEAILVVNPVTSEVSLEGELGSSRDGHYGFTVATTSYVCGIPWAATKVCCALSTRLIHFGQLSPEPGKWRTAAAHQERIYALPVQADGVLEIQPLEQKLRQLDHVASGAS